MRLPLLLLLLVLVSVVVRSEQGQWNVVNSGATSPGARCQHAAAYCPDRDSMILFGGYVQTGASVYNQENDVWEYSFLNSTWTLFSPPVKPPPMRGMTLTTISSSSEPCQIILFGGGQIPSDNNIQDYNQAWLIQFVSGSITFELLNVVNPISARSFHQAVNRHGSLLVFGGIRYSTYSAFSDMWSLSLGSVGANNTREPSVWVQIPYSNMTSSISARFTHAMGIFEAEAPDEDVIFVFAGRQLNQQPTVFNVLSDVWTFNFSTSSWTLASGLPIGRASHNAYVVNGVSYSFGGMNRIFSTPTQSVTYGSNEVLITDLLLPAATIAADGVPSCIDSFNEVGLWCDAITTPVQPALRSDFSSILRQDVLYIYGGSYESLFSDFWSINLTEASGYTILASDNLGGSDGILDSTLFFLVAILSMMAICLSLFVINLHRQRRATPVIMVARPQMLGARESVISALPLKTYRKTAESEERKARRNSHLDSVNSFRSPNVEKEALDKADEKAVRKTDLSASALKPEVHGLQEIDQDDLHDICAICLTEYEDGEQLRVLPCEHFFHPGCVDQWLRNHNACPMCKGVVDPDPGHVEEANETQIVAAGPEVEANNPTFNNDNEGQEEDTAIVRLTSSILNDEVRQRLTSRDSETSRGETRAGSTAGSRVDQPVDGSSPSRAESLFVEIPLEESTTTDEPEEPIFSFGRISQSLHAVRLSTPTPSLGHLNDQQDERNGLV